MAAPFSTDGITIDTPVGFEGPVTQTNIGGRVFGFSKPSSGARTLLQISIFDPRNNALPPALTTDQLSLASEKYVLDLMKGVERRRTEFSREGVLHLSLGGIPAAKVSWRGNARGIATNGVMYCVIVNGRLVSLDTQDAGTEITANMREAIKAFEAMNVK